MGTAILAPITAALAALLLGACGDSLEQREATKGLKASRAEATASDLHHLPQPYARAEDGRFNPHIKAGFEAEERDDPEAAIAEYTQAILLKPQDPDAYYNRGNAYHRLGRQQSAVEAHVNRGLAYIGLGRPERAVEDATAAIKLDPFLA